MKIRPLREQRREGGGRAEGGSRVSKEGRRVEGETQSLVQSGKEVNCHHRPAQRARSGFCGGKEQGQDTGWKCS